jgi:hypothetical protein
VAFGDFIRRFFSKKRNPDLSQLETFAAEHKGVEGYVEPRTATNPTTLLLVDREGDHVRGAVTEPEDAIAFCERLGIPVYDAQVMGYPQRMRDFDRRGGATTPGAIDDQIADLEQRLKESGPNVPNE